MALSPGARLGPYEVLSALGAGGMGEVYRARDTRLDRTVAIKVLPSEVAGDSDLRARFEREARAVAALDHPHICGIYDVGHVDGTHYLVMPHLDGQTLAARLEKGPLPLDQALKIAAEIADALDKAHRQGIIHRDLKPANIMLTKSGSKLLDFGLAKLRATSGPISMSGMSRLATRAPETAHGMILGTVQYMSPEQVEGREADARTDIWALGVVIYEMVTGMRPFKGDTPASVIGAILKDHPPVLSSRQLLAPRTLDQLVERCLAKDPDERWQSIGDVKHQLTQIAATFADADSSTSRRNSLGRSPWIAAAGAVGLSAVVAGFVIWSGALRPTESNAPLPIRLALDLGRDALFATDLPVAALSKDGTRIVLVSTSADGIARLSTRRLDQFDATLLAGTEGASLPFFSPDAQWVGFFAGGKLKKTRLDGGAPVVLCDAPAGRGGSWGEDGTIVAALDVRGGLSVVPSSVGPVTSVTELAAGEISHRWPQILPGGKAVLFTVGSVPSNYSAAGIAVASLESNLKKEKKIVLPNAGMSPHYLPTGHLVYVRGGRLLAAPFDVTRLEIQGTAVPVLEDLSAAVSWGAGQFDFSNTGTVLYRSGRASGETVVQWLKADGKTESLWAEPAFLQLPSISPDGSRLATVITEGPTSHIWVYDWQRGHKNRLSVGSGVNTFPIWSPDGQHVVFQSGGQLFSARADGAEEPQPLTKIGRRGFPSSFTPNGQNLFFYQLKAGGGSVIQSMPIKNEAGTLKAGEPQLFRESSTSIPAPVISPDGRWVAYASSESGVYEVYVRAFPDNGRQWSISTGGGSFPVWSRTRNELFYRTESQFLMVVDYTSAGGSFVVGKPRLWSKTRLFDTGLTQNFDLAPDGQRFAVLMPAEGPEPGAPQLQTILILNFFDEVRRRVAAGQNAAIK